MLPSFLFALRGIQNSLKWDKIGRRTCLPPPLGVQLLLFNTTVVGVSATLSLSESHRVLVLLLLLPCRPWLLCWFITYKCSVNVAAGWCSYGRYMLRVVVAPRTVNRTVKFLPA